MTTIEGQSPNGGPRLLNVSADGPDRAHVVLHMHSPMNPTNGWQIRIGLEELLDALRQERLTQED